MDNFDVVVFENRFPARPEVAYVFIIENKGPQTGVTLSHPHGQI